MTTTRSPLCIKGVKLLFLCIGKTTLITVYYVMFFISNNLLRPVLVGLGPAFNVAFLIIVESWTGRGDKAIAKYDKYGRGTEVFKVWPIGVEVDSNSGPVEHSSFHSKLISYHHIEQY